MSDHKPVSAVFNVTARIIVQDSFEKIKNEEINNLSKFLKEDTTFLNQKVKILKNNIKLLDFEFKKYEEFIEIENYGELSYNFKILNLKSNFIKVYPMEGKYPFSFKIRNRSSKKKI
jgi:hypothetical protein